MAKSTQAASAAGDGAAAPYDETATYSITLARLIKLGGVVPLIPRGDIFVSGAALNQIVTEHGADAILSAERR
ncbi:hypothetical protein T281_12885 [Rhodomicrobium udaipurense JA643]|uniref:Uncharacterized protein n=1 Tax=Rhodomicrobium udaipurense TaxID=1202716 RepID=A0A8I1KLF9_9HYPH|nr:hypothetical protein [Rhodomicrobium udaipurense]KAI94104.1 hypothetical protein T281_12885 [Rhodomicrobium udaipurense JA643]MBJ7543268.1 hypothetical protein [Rhodomicrobium udaipurense]